MSVITRLSKRKKSTKEKTFFSHPTRIVFLGFIYLILFGAVLLNMPFSSISGKSIGFLNALFTSTSATCVTGLVVVDTYSHWTIFGKTVILILIQLGGIGFMSIAALFSFMIGRTITLKERLVMSESVGFEKNQGVVNLFKRILLFTFIFELIGAILYSFRFVPIFGGLEGIYRSIFHSVSAFCNAGFDLLGSFGEFGSLTPFKTDWLINITTMLLIIIGGIGFIVIDDLFKSRFRFKKMSLHSKVVIITSLLLIFIGFLSILIFESSNQETLKNASFSETFLVSMFQSVTARTAGFNTINLAKLTDASLLVMMILMFIGGSPGSTAGGVKTSTIAIIVFTAWSVLRGNSNVNLFGRQINSFTVLKALVVLVLGILIILIGTTLLLTFDGATLKESIFEVISAFGTVGVTLGITPALSEISKIILIFIMFLGRVGIMTTALALSTKAYNTNAFEYPEGKIYI